MKITPLLLGLTLLIITFTSCEDFIDVDQPDIIEQEQAFDDKNSTRLSMIGIYGLIADLVEPMFLAGEVRADLITANQSANTYIQEFSNNSFSPSNPYVSPKPFYTIVNNANDFFNVFQEKIDNAEQELIDAAEKVFVIETDDAPDSVKVNKMILLAIDEVIETLNDTTKGPFVFDEQVPEITISIKDETKITEFTTFENAARSYITQLEGYKSELVAIRVWTQYQISKIFGKCIYYTEKDDITSDVAVKEYAYSDTNFLNMLLDDIAYSDTNNYTDIDESLIWQTVRISDFYVNVIIGEILLDLGKYEEAFDKFEEVTDDGDAENKTKDRFSLTQGDFEGGMWYAELFAEDWELNGLLINTGFMIAFDNKYNQSNQLWSWTLSLDYQIEPTAGFVNKFYLHSISDPENTDYRIRSIRNSDNSTNRLYAINKYRGDDRPLIMTRTARIELLKAFCLTAMDDTKKALKIIKNVRKRIDYPEIDDELMPEDDEDPNVAINWLQDIIIDELAYETCFEGQRWWDLMREANRRDDPSYLADKVAAKYPAEIRDQIKSKLLVKDNWYVPVFE